MFCYGEKEDWFTRKVNRRGMLPAIQLDGKVIIESDVILEALETTFGPLHKSMFDPQVKRLRDLERLLFRAWCSCTYSVFALTNKQLTLKNVCVCVCVCVYVVLALTKKQLTLKNDRVMLSLFKQRGGEFDEITIH